MAHDDTVQIAAASPARRRALARMWRESESGTRRWGDLADSGHG
jgi:hypothetical protein